MNLVAIQLSSGTPIEEIFPELKTKRYPFPNFISGPYRTIPEKPPRKKTKKDYPK
jgi:hypothetical protein